MEGRRGAGGGAGGGDDVEGCEGLKAGFRGEGRESSFLVMKVREEERKWKGKGKGLNVAYRKGGGGGGEYSSTLTVAQSGMTEDMSWS
jgi:hypothetical protein